MKNSHRFSIAICCALTTLTSSIWAQEAPTTEAPTIEAVTAKVAKTEFSWREDTRLNAKITLQAKRMPLAEFLTTVSAQSGITLDGGELATAKRVTLSVSDMPLRDAMISLADLYQADWQVQGDNGYLLKTREMLPWQRNLAQLGNLDNWGFYRTNWSRPFAPPYITTEYSYDRQELLDSLDRQALLSPQGIAFSSLPPETQREIRHSTSWEIIKQAIWGASVTNAIEGNWKLRLRPSNYPTPEAIEFFDAPIPDDPAPAITELISDERMLLRIDLGPSLRDILRARLGTPPPHANANAER